MLQWIQILDYADAVWRKALTKQGKDQATKAGRMFSYEHSPTSIFQWGPFSSQ